MKGDRVLQKPDPFILGTVESVDLDCCPLEEYGVTTAKIKWDDSLGFTDTKWTNKLEKIED